MTRDTNRAGRPAALDELLFILNCYDVWSGPRADTECRAVAADREETR